MTTQPGARPHEHADAAYVLGALSPDDRVTFERHLSTCPDCTRAVAGLAGLPGLLARVPAEVADPPAHRTPTPPVPETLLPRLVREARRTQRSRAWLTAVLVGAAAAVALVAVGFAATHDRSDQPDPAAAIAPAVAMESVTDDPVAASVSLTAVSWGTRLELTCDDREAGAPTGPPEPEWATYAMFLRTRDGHTEKLATWQALPGKIVHVSGATATDRADIADVFVSNAAGVKVLDLSSS